LSRSPSYRQKLEPYVIAHFQKQSVFGDYDNYDELDDVIRKGPRKQQEPSNYKKLMQIPGNLVREAAKLVMMIEGKNITNFDRKMLEILSPRFFSVVPDEDDEEKVRSSRPTG
ncbi:hypothetical protein COOONC_03135, partial [Cooperia oncophora]